MRSLFLLALVSVTASAADLSVLFEAGRFREVRDVTVVRRETLNRPDLPSIHGWLQWVDVKVRAVVEVGSRTDVAALVLRNELLPEAGAGNGEPRNPTHVLQTMLAGSGVVRAGWSGGQIVTSTKKETVEFTVALVWGGYGRHSAADREMTFKLGALADAPTVRAIVNQKTNKVEVSFTNPPPER